MKFVYLTFYMATAVYVTFVSLYFHAIHLSGAQIGFISSIVPLTSVALQPVWGLLSDRYRLRKPVLALALLAAAVLAPAVALAHSFVILVVLVICMATAISPVVPLADASTLEWISIHGGAYGPIRVYGSIGFLFSSLAVGYILTGSRIHLLFPLYGLLLGVTFLVSLWAPRQSEALEVVHRGNIAAALHNRAVVRFLILAAVGFGTSAAYNTFFALYLHDLGAGTAFIGLAVAIATLSELPVMALSGRVMARVGVKPLLLAGFAAAAVRWLAYALLHDYRVALIFQPLHGLTFAGSYVAGVTFIDGEMPAQLRATGQTLFYGATFGLGVVLGANLFGLLFDRVQAQGMFLAASALAAAAAFGIAVFVPNRGPATARHLTARPVEQDEPQEHAPRRATQ